MKASELFKAYCQERGVSEVDCQRVMMVNPCPARVADKEITEEMKARLFRWMDEVRGAVLAGEEPSEEESELIEVYRRERARMAASN